MKIENFTKQKGGQYKISFEDKTNISIHEDLILKYDLLLTKEIERTILDKLLKENIYYNTYNIALKYIGVKMRSIKEIGEYLRKKQLEEVVIEEVVNKLLEQGYLNEELYTIAFINDRINLSNDGPYKIKKYLIDNNIDEHIINKNIIIFTTELEEEKIEKLINQQLRNNRNKSNYLLKQKIVNYLVNLGYSKGLVITKLEDINIDDKDIAKKEYQKIYNRLSKKYEGKELEYKIRQKMYQKGFTSY